MQQAAERPGLAGQDDGQFVVAEEFPCLGQLPVQAAQHVLAAVGQGVPGVRVGDHQQVTGGPNDLLDEGPGFPGGDARQVRGGDLDQLPVAQQAQVVVQAGDRPGGTGLSGAGSAGEHQVLPRRPADLDAGPAAGLLGAQHRDQPGELFADCLQAVQRGQLADVLLEPGSAVQCRHRPVQPFQLACRRAVLAGDGCAEPNLPPAV